MVEPQIDGIPVVHQSLVDADTIDVARVQRQRRAVLQFRVDGPAAAAAAARRRDRVVRTRAGRRALAAFAAAARRGATAAAAAGADGASAGTAVRRRVSGVAAARGVAAALASADVVNAAAAAAASATPATGAVPATLHPGYGSHVGAERRLEVLRRWLVIVAGPHGTRHAELVRVDDALLDGRQPRRRRPQLQTVVAGRRPVRRRRRWRVPAVVSLTLRGGRRVLVRARVVRVRLALVPGTAALVVDPRLMMQLVVHVDRIYPAYKRAQLLRCII